MNFAVRGKVGAAMAAGVAVVLLIDRLTHSAVASLIGAGFVVAAGSLEFYQLAERKSVAAFKALGVLASLAVLLVVAAASFGRELGRRGVISAAICLAFWWLAFALLFPRRERAGGALGARIGLTLAGVVYVGFLGSFLMVLRGMEGIGLSALALVLILAKGGDMAAYLTGSAFGAHKLAASISPKKSVEGAAAHLGIGLLLAVLITRMPGMNFLRPSQALVFGALVSASAQAGDLVESKIKRTFGAKDSADTIPEFGGVLDVIDCLLLAAPVSYLFLRFLGGA